jgi:chromosome segregation ATPase
VNNFRALVSFTLLALLAASGCEKTNDVPRLRDEVLATAKDYQQRVDELQHRADEAARRANTLPRDALNSADAQRVFRQALGKLGEARRHLQQAQAAVKSDSVEELEKLLDSVRERVESEVVETTSEISAVESWIGTVEQRQGAAGAPPAATAPATGDAPPVDPGTAAPVR